MPMPLSRSGEKAEGDRCPLEAAVITTKTHGIDDELGV